MKEAIDIYTEVLSRVAGNKAAAARALGIPVTTLKDRLARAAEAGDPATSEVRDTIFKLAQYNPNPPKWVINGGAPGKSPGTPTILISDMHYGEVVDPAQVNRYNTFNPAIAEKRLKTLAHKVVELCYLHRPGHKYSCLVMPLLGDLVSGNIHEEFKETNDGSTLEHVMKVSDLLIGLIDSWRESFPKIFVPTCFGNHGRTQKKPPYKNAAATNYDWLIYCILARHYRDDPSVIFQVPYGYESYYTVNGVRYLATHGDRLGVRGGDNLTGLIGPISRGIEKLRRTYNTMGSPVDYVLMGHWHTVLRPVNGRVNGSIKGYDEFAMGNRLTPELPAQLLWFTHPTYGIIGEDTLYLEEPKAHPKRITMAV